MPNEFMKSKCAGVGSITCRISSRKGFCSEVADCFVKRSDVLPHSGSEKKNWYNVGVDLPDEFTSKGDTHQEHVVKRPMSPRNRTRVR